MILEPRALAERVRQVFFYYTPYRTGNLARSVGDTGYYGANSAGFKAFSMVAAPYGALLNDYPTINRSFVTKDGKVKKVSYKNIHYDWINKAVNNAVDDLVATIPNARRV